MPFCVHNFISAQTTRNSSFLTSITTHVSPRSLTVKSRASTLSGESAMASTSSVRIAAAQMTSINDLAANFATCSRLVKEAASAGAKLLCLPESFSYIGARDGDSVKIAEPLDGPIMKKYCSLARESGIWLSLGGFQERGFDDAHLCNTHVIVDDGGNIRSTYRKIHL
ncbi:Deaminated glutathione amidase, chloroplastic/cytosolic [Linum perenne]